MNMTLYVVIAWFSEPAAIDGERPELIKAETSLDVAGDLMLKTHNTLRKRNPKTYLRTEVFIFKRGKRILFAEMSSPSITKVDSKTFNKSRATELQSFELA